jgi:Thymidylate synthase
MEIRAANVNRAVAEGFYYLAISGEESSSRNGPVIVAPEPVMTVYDFPLERVLFSPLRDANPFFHLMEALWMLAGRNDVAWPAFFASRMKTFSDDGTTLHGAYGYRWRRWFGYDQLALIIQELKDKPDSRRCVLSMWDASIEKYDSDPEMTYLTKGCDLRKAIAGGKDVPCNTAAYVDIRGGRLNLTVLCRSNDMYWGAYGANAVHFSVLQEYLAAAVGAPIGKLYQFSNNYHAYPANLGGSGDRERLKEIARDAKAHDYYYQQDFTHFPLVSTPLEVWNRNLESFMNNPLQGAANYDEPFFSDVAEPLYVTWYARKVNGFSGLAQAGEIAAQDWRKACKEWIQRRAAKR